MKENTKEIDILPTENTGKLRSPVFFVPTVHSPVSLKSCALYFQTRYVVAQDPKDVNLW